MLLIKSKNNGFTIVELLVVIIVIGIIATISIISYNGITKKASDIAFSSDIKNIKDAAMQKMALEGTTSGKIKDLKINGLASSSGQWHYDSTSGSIYLLDFTKGTRRYTDSAVANSTIDTSESQYSQSVSLDNNTVKNNSAISNWANNATMLLENNCGNNGGDCLTINGTNADASFQYTAHNLIPNYPYTIEAYIKGENIGPNTGAQISGTTWDRSGNNQGTFGYQQNQYTAIANKSGDLTFKLRLGYWASTNSGKAYFDDVKITPYKGPLYTSKHIRFLANDSQINGIDSSVIYNWMFNLDKYIDNLCYITTTDCSNVGYDIVGLNISGFWAEASNSSNELFSLIHWNRDYVASMLNIMKNNDKELSFGIMHEIGHKFVNSRWNWHSEFWANTNMILGLYNMQYGFVDNNITYVGSPSGTSYKPINEKYCADTNCAVTSADKFDSYLAIIQKDIGIEPFKKTFNDFKNLPTNSLPQTNNDKLTLFIDTLLNNYNATVSPSQYKYRSTYFTTNNWNLSLSVFP